MLNSLNKEIKVYVINAGDFDFRGCEHVGDYKAIKEEAEKQGTVYSLEFFQEQINDEQLLLDNSFIYIE